MQPCSPGLCEVRSNALEAAHHQQPSHVTRRSTAAPATRVAHMDRQQYHQEHRLCGVGNERRTCSRGSQMSTRPWPNGCASFDLRATRACGTHSSSEERGSADDTLSSRHGEANLASLVWLTSWSEPKASLMAKSSARVGLFGCHDSGSHPAVGGRMSGNLQLSCPLPAR